MKPWSADQLTVAVTGVAATENPGPGIGVARSLRLALGAEIRLVGLAYDAAECLALDSEVFDAVYLIPYPGQGVESGMERLREILQEQSLDILIPCLDVEVPLYIRAQNQLEELGLKLCLPTSESFRMRDKDQLPALANALGLRLPSTVVVASPDQILKGVEQVGFPLYVKGNASGAAKVSTMPELYTQVEAFTAQWGYPVIFQQFISGTDMVLAGLGDGRGGSCCGNIALRKEQQTSQGKLWNAVTVQCSWLQRAAEAFLSCSQWRGPFELECIADAAGRGWLLEINPRFPAWIYAGALLGVNLPACLVRSLRGESERTPELIPAGKWIVRSVQENVLDHEPVTQLLTEGRMTHAQEL